jgi:phage-related protein
MAVFKSLTFDGENSLDYGVYITGEAVYNAPGRVVDMVTIPGRNGSLAIDQGRFENIEIKYPAGAFGTTQTEYSSVMRAFRNFLASRYRYVRLEDDYHPDEYRLGLFKSGLEADPVSMSRAGEFDIVFDCKPQRFLKSGEIPVSGADWTNVQTASGSVVTIDNSGNPLGIKSLTASIDPVQSGSGTTSPTNVRPISGRTAVSVYVSPTESEADGDTYNTSLGRIVYGGTLDLISGVLTVTKVAIDMGTLSWTYNATSQIHTAVMPSDAIAAINVGDRGAICSVYERGDYPNNFADGKFVVCDSNLSSSAKRVAVKNTAITDAAAFKTSVTGQTLVYTLATPQTYQVTAKDIELLTGTNKIWASTGDVTVEYGQSPFYNPTEFPSKPLIKVTGTGTLMVGGVTITITGIASQTIYIDCESMEIYKMVDGEVQSAASLVTFSGNDFPVLSAGNTGVSYGSGITALEITPHWWRI